MVDSHSHVDAEAFDTDREDVLNRARRAGIVGIVDPGCDLPSSEKAVALAHRHADVWAAVGVHPHSAQETTAEVLARLEALAGDARVVAIGETGLDYHYNFSPPEQQRASLAAHLELARRIGKPVILHCRNAEDDLLAALQGPLTGVVHCFTGPAQVALELVRRGFYIGITGIVSFKKADEVHETARVVPLERLLVETDAPYLAPIPHRGKRNEPSFLPFTVQAIAARRGMPAVALAAATADNARRLFGLR
ncbi:MAG: TatD family hydrolase [Candidatus Xenobia bacterium]